MIKQKTLNLLLLMHQPYRVNWVDKIDSFDDLKKVFIGPDYSKGGIKMFNKDIFEKVAKNSYIPVLKFFIDLEKKNPSFKINLSFSGTLISQCLEYKEYGDQVLELMKTLFSQPNVEIASENYYHSLAYFIDTKEFTRQIVKHQKMLGDLFGLKPEVFRHTENIMDENIANQLRMLGFKGASMPHLDKRFGQEVYIGYGKVRNKVFDNDTNEILVNANNFGRITEDFVLIPQNVHISKYLFNMGEFNGVQFIEDVLKGSHHKLIFNDFEGLGEHSSIENGSLTRFQQMIKLLDGFKVKSLFLSNIANQKPESIFEIKELMATASVNQDIHVWRGNYEQEKCFIELVKLYKLINSKFKEDDLYYEEIMDIFGKLSTSDHFFYLNNSAVESEKDVHEMFSPYPSREIAYQIYMDTITKINKFLTKI